MSGKQGRERRQGRAGQGSAGCRQPPAPSQASGDSEPVGGRGPPGGGWGGETAGGARRQEAGVSNWASRGCRKARRPQTSSLPTTASPFPNRSTSANRPSRERRNPVVATAPGTGAGSRISGARDICNRPMGGGGGTTWRGVCGQGSSSPAQLPAPPAGRVPGRGHLPYKGRPPRPRLTPQRAPRGL